MSRRWQSIPKNSDALAGSAFTYYIDYYYGLRPDITDYDAKILAPADLAISLDPNNVQAYLVKGMYLVGTHTNARRASGCQ